MLILVPFHLGPLLPIDNGDNSDVSFPVTDEERSLFDYQSLVSDWPDEGREEAIDRISQGLWLHELCKVANSGDYVEI